MRHTGETLPSSGFCGNRRRNAMRRVRPVYRRISLTQAIANGERNSFGSKTENHKLQTNHPLAEQKSETRRYKSKTKNGRQKSWQPKTEY